VHILLKNMEHAGNLGPSANISDFDIQAVDIRTQLDKIIASSEPNISPRLQELLSYIVEESLAGRAGRIKGLTIAKAIYSVGENFDPEVNSIVRVEAGRLRRRLAEYYMTAGSDDPIIVDIPKGSYVPRFTRNPKTVEISKPAQNQPRPAVAKKYFWLISSVLITVIVLALVWRNIVDPDSSGMDDKSVDTLQLQAPQPEAQVLFQQAFELMMPPQDGARLGASKELFERVIEIDSDFAGGYAGKSIALSFQIIFIKSDNPGDDLAASLIMAKNAVEIEPEFELGYAALSLALALRGEADLALANVRRTLTIQPHDPRATAIASATLIISGKPQLAIDLLSEAIQLNPHIARMPYLNLLGIAQYVIGNYAGAAESFEKNLARGGPKGPHMDVFQAAAYVQTGKDFEAQAIVEKLQRTHPDYPFKQWLNNFIKSEDEVLAIMNQLQLSGSSSP
jgi:tetratricopeptide (TPR) repeat protein